MSETAWGTTEEHYFKPNPSLILGRKAYFFLRCCGERMLRVKKITTARCTHCERHEVTEMTAALCKKCGRHFETIF